MPLQIPQVNSVTECYNAIGALMAKYNITAIGIVLVQDDAIVTTHQFGMSDTDMLIAAELFTEFMDKEDVT